MIADWALDVFEFPLEWLYDHTPVYVGLPLSSVYFLLAIFPFLLVVFVGSLVEIVTGRGE